MQKTSELYQELLASNYKTETRLAIGETGKLITRQGDTITFGGTSILVGATGADGGYDESLLVSMETRNSMFPGENPLVDCCAIGEIDIEMHKPIGEIPAKARLVPYVRLTDGVRASEWIQKGVFYVDTRKKKEDGSAIEKIVIEGYDDMRRTEQDYPSSSLRWPAKDIDVVREIASFIRVSVDPRTAAIMNHGYSVQYPGGYSCREVLSYIAAMYAGCFIMSDLGELRLVALNSIPAETRYLIAEGGQPITFGGVRILV